MNSHFLKLKRFLGVLLFDWPRYFSSLYLNKSSYLSLCNRSERLKSSADGEGYICMWRWASDLHAPKVIPMLGQRLYDKAFSAHPIVFACQPLAAARSPEVTFVIGHRGMDRLPLLQATLASIAGQTGASVQCIVVEHDTNPLIQGILPAWVKYVHFPPPVANSPFNRAMAFNAGVQVANADLLILHDNDIPVPRNYAAANLQKMKEGFDVINLKRFVFYLDSKSSRDICLSQGISNQPRIEAIVQNLQGGGSIAITREAFLAIGGMDESFVGWGGEDSEFWERAVTQKVYAYGYLSLIHLWHEAQPEKFAAQLKGVDRFTELSRVSPKLRIKMLRMSRSKTN